MGVDTYPPRGNCYEDAAKFMLSASNNEDLVLVHGIVTSDFGILKGIKFIHGWVEDENYCYQKTELDQPHYSQIDKEDFYRKGNIKETAKYTFLEMVEMLLDEDFYGYWDKRFDAVNKESLKQEAERYKTK